MTKIIDFKKSIVKKGKKEKATDDEFYAEMPSREAVKMLQALFIADGMILESEDLDLIDMCAEFCKDVYDYFTDFFLQADEIEPFLVANWLSEPDACIVLKMPGGEHDKNYCHM